MKPKNRNISNVSGKISLSVVMTIAAVAVALIGAALLIDNIYVYSSTLKQYVAQGYPAATVNKTLIPSQLLPGIFQPIALYWGMAFILLGVGIVNGKVTKCLVSQAEDPHDTEGRYYDDTGEEDILEQKVEAENGIDTEDRTDTEDINRT